MIKIFLNSVLFVLILRSEVLTVNAADSCAVTAPDSTLNPILANGSLSFSINFYNELKSAPNTTNLFCSPFSVRTALAMTAVGAGGNTLTQMNTALQLNGFKNEDQINQAFQSNLGSFCPNSDYTLTTANRIYIQQGFGIIQNFTQTLNTYYLSSAVNENFGGNSSGAASDINKWVAQQTNNTIKDLFSSNSFSADTALVLVNAIYFKGNWLIKFNTANTKPQTFYLANGQKIQVPTMYVQSKFKYYFSTALNSQVLQLNYAGNRLAMHIILPQNGTDLATVQQNLNSQNVNDYVNKLATQNTQEVKVYLPKFTANYKQTLNTPLQSLGMNDVFSATDANLTGIAPPTTVYGNLYVSSVIHQAYVDVNEQGTVAAAATGVGVVGAMAVVKDSPPPILFDVNRPCIYFICDLQFNQILFMGNLDNPSTSS